MNHKNNNKNKKNIQTGEEPSIQTELYAQTCVDKHNKNDVAPLWPRWTVEILHTYWMWR